MWSEVAGCDIMDYHWESVWFFSSFHIKKKPQNQYQIWKKETSRFKQRTLQRIKEINKIGIQTEEIRRKNRFVEIQTKKSVERINEINKSSHKFNKIIIRNEEIRRNNRIYLPCHRKILPFQEEKQGNSELKGEIHIMFCVPTFRIA